MDSLWNKAREAADDARLLYTAGRHDGACNRAYYAMFNAARALLIMRGVDPDRAKRHATVWRLFSLHFVKDGPFDAADGRALGEAGRARNQADYSVKEVDAEAATDVMASLERFMVAAGSLLEDASATRRSGP